MVSSTQPVAFPAPRQASERLIWALGGLVLVISATFSAMMAPALAQAQQWPFIASQPSEAPSAAPAGVLETALPAAATGVAAPIETPVPLPARIGTVAGDGDAAFLAALLEASTRNVELAPAAAAAEAQPTAAPAVAPVTSAQPAPTAAATPVATAVATAVATPAPTAAPSPVASASAPPAPLPSYSARAAGLFLAMNEERVAAGLAPLVASEAASEIAMHRALDMQQNDYFAHVSPSGENWLQLVNEAGIALTAGGENLAKISGDVERSVTVAITKLMESPTHAANILGVYYDSVGVAAVTDERGVTIFVTIFLG